MKRTILPDDAPLGDRIRTYLNDRSIRHSRIGDAIGVDPRDGTLSRMLSGERPSLVITKSIARKILRELGIKPGHTTYREWMDLAAPDPEESA